MAHIPHLKSPSLILVPPCLAPALMLPHPPYAPEARGLGPSKLGGNYLLFF
jgi:hypothetical protein